MIAPVAVLETIERELGALEGAGLLRRPPTLERTGDPSVVRLGDRRVTVFCSNDYLGLASDPRLRSAMHSAIDEHGAGAGASRLVSGTLSVHRRAERELAALVHSEDALLFSSGYACNAGALPALLGREDIAFSDRANHASLIDGLRLSRARTVIYDHADASALEHLLRVERPRYRRAWIVTESIFSMDGDAAPLQSLRALADTHDAGLFVDEAHSLGLVGPQGRGLCAELGVRADALVGTLGKALGVAGAFIAGTSTLRTLLENRARSYVFSTGVPPVLAAAVGQAVELAIGANEERARALGYARRLRCELGQMGYRVPSDGPGAIVPLLAGEPWRAMELSAKLLERGFFVQGIRPPTVPAGTSRLRIVPTAAHRIEDVGALLSALDTLPR
jgi:8-amino-7-oxononanoate synthase